MQNDINLLFFYVHRDIFVSMLYLKTSVLSSGSTDALQKWAFLDFSLLVGR